MSCLPSLTAGAMVSQPSTWGRWPWVLPQPWKLCADETPGWSEGIVKAVCQVEGLHEVKAVKLLATQGEQRWVIETGNWVQHTWVSCDSIVSCAFVCDWVALSRVWLKLSSDFACWVYHGFGPNLKAILVSRWRHPFLGNQWFKQANRAPDQNAQGFTLRSSPMKHKVKPSQMCNHVITYSHGLQNCRKSFVWMPNRVIYWIVWRVQSRGN